MAINWQIFGLNNLETADFSRGVLERFTRRAQSDWVVPISTGAPGGNAHIKTLANPRMISHILNPHFPVYFEGLYSVNENCRISQSHFNNPVTVSKIVINHYYEKSLEEFRIKQNRGRSDTGGNYDDTWYNLYNRNEEFDDSILKYRAEREKIYQPPDKSHANERLLTALMKNLLPTLKPDTPPEFYAGKMETFLTCRAVAEYLKTKLVDDAPAKFFEEASLVAILRAFTGMNFADSRMLIRELPELLRLPYPVIKDLRVSTLQIIPQMMNIMHLNSMWKDYVELDYLKEIFKE